MLKLATWIANSSTVFVSSDAETLRCEYSDSNRKKLCCNNAFILSLIHI